MTTNYLKQVDVRDLWREIVDMEDDTFEWVLNKEHYSFRDIRISIPSSKFHYWESINNILEFVYPKSKKHVDMANELANYLIDSKQITYSDLEIRNGIVISSKTYYKEGTRLCDLNI